MSAEFRLGYDSGVAGLVVRQNETPVEALADLVQCNHLQTLTLEGFTQISDGVLQNLQRCGALRMLRILGATELRDRSVGSLSQLGIRRLDLRQCGVTIGRLQRLDQIPRVIAPDGSHVVFEADASNLSADGKKLKGRIDKKPLVTQLDLSDLPGLTDDDLKLLIACKKLEQLSLAGCTQLTGGGFQYVPATVGELNIAGCTAVRDAALWDLPVDLGVINVTGCTGVRGHDLGRQFPKLTRVDLDLSEEGKRLQALLAKGGDSLDTRSCQGIVDRDLMLLAPHQTMATVHLRGCLGLTSEALLYLPESVRTLDLEDMKIDDTALDRAPRLLTELSLRGCKRVVGSRLAQFSLLKKLNVEKCWAVQFTSLPAPLVELRVSNNEGFNDTVIARLPKNLTKLHVSKCHNLTEAALATHLTQLDEVSVMGCRQVQDTEKVIVPPEVKGQGMALYRQVLRNPWRREINLNGIGGIENAHLGIMMKLRQLQKVVFNNCAFDDNGLRLLARLSSLQEVELSYCDLVTGRGFDAFSAGSPLQTVKLKRCYGITDDGLRAVARSGISCFELDYVDPEHSGRMPTFTDEGVSSVVKASGMQRVVIEAVPRVTNKSVAAALKNPDLRTLIVGASSDITVDPFSAVTKQSQLTHLEIRTCGSREKGIHERKELDEAQRVGLADKSRSTATAPAGDAPKLTVKREQRIYGKFFARSGVFRQAGSLEFLRHFQKLETLALNGLVGIPKNDIQFIRMLPELKVLSLSSCRGLTTAHLQELCKDDGRMDLRRLHLSECTEVDTALVKEIVKRYPNLQGFDVRDCAKLDDQGMNELAKLSDLESLDIGYCDRVTVTGITLVVNGCRKLTSLQTKGILVDPSIALRMQKRAALSDQEDAHRRAMLAMAGGGDVGDDTSAAAAAAAGAAHEYGHTPGGVVAVDQYGMSPAGIGSGSASSAAAAAAAGGSPPVVTGQYATTPFVTGHYAVNAAPAVTGEYAESSPLEGYAAVATSQYGQSARSGMGTAAAGGDGSGGGLDSSAGSQYGHGFGSPVTPGNAPQYAHQLGGAAPKGAEGKKEE